ncbi:RDD family protein [Candidatus Anstonella stagnisolia]|nr:RDD family protein [Candidatus Anstonella stagnisolia]
MLNGENLASKKPKYVGFWARLVAYIIDSIASQIAMIILLLPVILLINNQSPVMLQIAGISYALFVIAAVLLAYYVYAESSAWQATLGKKLLGMKVTDLKGKRISFLRSLGRNLAKILSAIPVDAGYIMIGFTEKKQGLHDMLAGTLVVKR